MKQDIDFAAVEEQQLSWRVFVGWVIVAYLFSIAIRWIWVDWASQFPEFFWNDQLMINTNDGYFWAEGARDILAGFHQPNDLSPINQPISKLTALLAQLLPFSFETIILFMPAFFGALLVVPIMLIARTLKQDMVGFIAALLGGIAWSYYNRTMTGYYDTDMLTVVLPTFVLWGLILAIEQKREHYPLLLALLMVIYQWWYPSAVPLDTAFTGIVLLYTLIFERKQLFNYKLLIFMLVAITPLAMGLKVTALIALFLFFLMGKERAERAILPLLGVAVLLFMAMGGLAPIWYQIKGYLLRESVAATEAVELHFFAVNKTVREAGQIPFELFANRISGHPIIFILSLIGYVMLALRYRVMWLALPMLELGFLAMKGGLRFTVYAVPVCALGMGYLIVWMAQRVSGYAATPKGERIVEYSVVTLALLAILYPNIDHAKNYNVPTVFTKPEVKVLDQLKQIATREDYVLTWWDYGYPIRYYSDVKTLIDGGKHTGDVNYPVSFALTRPQHASANMARLDTEYTELAYQKGRSGAYIKMMMDDYGFQTPEDFLKALNDPNLKLPQKSRDVYYYLPLRMLDIFPTVAIFSAIDLRSGDVIKRPFFYQAKHFQNSANQLILANNIILDKRTGMMQIGPQKVPLHSFVIASLGKDGKVHSQEQVVHTNASLYLIFMQSYNRFLLLDEEMFHSTYIQLFVLGRYDANLFEPVIISPMASVYRLKR